MLLKRKAVWGLLLAACAMGCARFAAAQGETANSAKRTLVRAGHVLDVKTGKVADAETIVVVGRYDSVHCADRFCWPSSREIR